HEWAAAHLRQTADDPERDRRVEEDAGGGFGRTCRSPATTCGNSALHPLPAWERMAPARSVSGQGCVAIAGPHLRGATCAGPYHGRAASARLAGADLERRAWRCRRAGERAAQRLLRSRTQRGPFMVPRRREEELLVRPLSDETLVYDLKRD